MLDSLYIKNFRLFKELELKRLGRVNLVVGKNNSGKSCLLEALRVYAKNASPRTLYELIIERGEDWEAEMQEDGRQSVQDIENPLRCLFHNYRFPELGDSMEIGSLTESRDRLKLCMHLYRRIENEKERIRIDFPGNALDDSELVIEVEKNNKISSLVRLNEDPRDYRKNIRISASGGELNVQLVPTMHMDNEAVLTLWNNINVKPLLRKEVFKGLQLIDDGIQEIVVITKPRRSAMSYAIDVIPVLIYKDSEKQLPLKSLGDGMTHLFHILLALVNARSGLLLIDEFENGLHYAAQSKIWRLIFDLATQLDVQVFAATHNQDCVIAFQQASQETGEEVMLFRLGRSRLKADDGKIIATAYNKEELEMVVRTELEVR